VSAALELIQIVELAGGRFMIDGDRLGIVPATAAAPVMGELRQHKAELLAELARRPAMPAGVRLISWSPKDAPVRLSECSTATNTVTIIRTTLIQLAARLTGASLACWGLGIVGPARPSGGLRLRCGA